MSSKSRLLKCSLLVISFVFLAALESDSPIVLAREDAPNIPGDAIAIMDSKF